MIIYLIKSGICLAILLAIYHLFLEKEKMHQFNRFYLLGSILFSFYAPSFIIYTEPININESIQPLFSELLEVNTTNNNVIPAVFSTPENNINFNLLFVVVYLLISSLLFFRFSKNIIKITSKIRNNNKKSYKNATIVLTSEKIVLHTFLHYIFINKKEFKKNTIEDELFTHELTHVSQKHTIDILIIEFLQIICWFNPLIIYLKKAIKLNHEFLADDSVIQSHKNTTEYQHLLLNKVALKNNIYLASNFNYSLTKKRLIMMTKQSSQLKMLFKKIAIIPLVFGLLFLFANRVEAQEKDDAIETNYKQTQNVKKNLDILKTNLPKEEDKKPPATNNFLASVERTENSIRLKCYDCYRWADLKLNLNTEYIINDFGFSKGKTIKSDKYAFSIKATKNQVVFKGLKNTAWKDLKFTLNNNSQQFFNQLGMVSNQKNTQEKATPEMIKEYNSLARKMKTNKSGHFKLKDIERLKIIYNLMTDKQKKGAESFPNIPPPPTVKSIKVKNIPPPPPIPAEATKEQKKVYKKATEKYKKSQKELKNVPPLPLKVKKENFKNIPPPPPIPAKATKDQKKAYKKATEKYKKSQKELKNVPQPPPIPTKATKEQKKAYKKATEKYNKAKKQQKRASLKAKIERKSTQKKIKNIPPSSPSISKKV